MPTTPRVYLWASGRGRGSSAATSSGCRASTGAGGSSSPMSTRCTTPHAAAAGSTRWAILWVPNVTVTSARTCAPSSSPVSTSTPDGVSTATTGGPATRRSAAAASSRSPPRPPIPTIPSTTTSGRVVEGAPWRTLNRTTRPPARRNAATPPSWAWSDEQPGLDRAAAAGQHRAGVQRVAAVVAGADQQQHPPAVGASRAGRARRTPVPPRPAASAHPRVAAPSAPPRPPAPARRCARSSCRQPRS